MVCLPGGGQLEALRVGVARGIGIDHGAAADRRPAAQDDPVAARCNDRRRQPELGVAAGAS